MSAETIEQLKQQVSDLEEKIRAMEDHHDFEKGCEYEKGLNSVYDMLAKGVDVFASDDTDQETPIGKVFYKFESGDRSVGIDDHAWFEFTPNKTKE